MTSLIPAIVSKLRRYILSIDKQGDSTNIHTIHTFTLNQCLYAVQYTPIISSVICCIYVISMIYSNFECVFNLWMHCIISSVCDVQCILVFQLSFFISLFSWLMSHPLTNLIIWLPALCYTVSQKREHANKSEHFYSKGKKLCPLVAAMCSGPLTLLLQEKLVSLPLQWRLLHVWLLTVLTMTR